MTVDKHEKTHESEQSHERAEFVEVAVSTTSGFFPNEGYERVPIHQKVKVQLSQAAKALGLVGTDDWIASVNKRPITPDSSYEQNDLSGGIEIDWGPSEGGGGNA